MSRRAHPFARAAGIALAASILFSLSGCSFVSSLFGPTSSTPAVTAPAWQNYLFMADTNSGKIYTYDPSTHAANATSLLTTGQNATGTINFYKGIGYAAVGFGTGAGVYWFDPAAANPVFTRLSTPSNTAINAQYFAFASPTLAYVSVAGTYDSTGATDSGGLYTFNPSNLAAGILTGPIAGTDKYLQDVKMGSDGKIYAAAMSHQYVIVMDTNNSNSTSTVAVSAPGPTGLCAGTYNGASGIFVASNGNYTGNGAIDFIAANGILTNIVPMSAGTTPSRLIQLTDGNLMATGSGHTWLISLGAGVAVKEILSGTSSFGSMDIVEKNNLVYVPTDSTSDYITYTNKLYIFDESGAQQTYSPVSVMTSTDGFTNLAFYSN